MVYFNPLKVFLPLGAIFMFFGLLKTIYDIWVGKFEDDLTFVDDMTVAGPTTDEDKGYGIVFNGSDTIFVTGTMIETGESYNIWLARLDTDLTLLDSLTINGPVDSEDVAYLMTMDLEGRRDHTGTYTETVGGRNIWLARCDPTLASTRRSARTSRS